MRPEMLPFPAAKLEKSLLFQCVILIIIFVITVPGDHWITIP